MDINHTSDTKAIVCILLSTYNGERYLKEQMDSLLSQDGVNVRIVVRDDGSSDSTIEILNEYIKTNDNITLLRGNNKGVEESFYSLLQFSFENCDYDYFAFSDQDDIWYNNKLLSAAKALAQHKDPTLYCCNQMITDQSLSPIRLMVEPDKSEDIKKSMINNFFSNRHGCTMVWNRALQMELKGIDRNMDFCPIHDVWVNLVARCSGSVIIDVQEYQIYRIHRNNASGLETSKFKRLKKGVNIFFIKGTKRYYYAKICFEHFKKDTKQSEGWIFLKKVSCYKDNYISKCSLVISKQIWYSGILEGLFKSISIIIGKY